MKVYGILIAIAISISLVYAINIATISKSTLIERNTAWVDIFNSPLLFAPSNGGMSNGVELLLSEQYQLSSVIPNATSNISTWSIAMGSNPSSSTLVNGMSVLTSRSYRFTDDSSYIYTTAVPTDNKVFCLRLVSDTPGRSGLIVPGGTVEIPTNLWSTLYIDQYTVSRNPNDGTWDLIAIQGSTLRFVDPEPNESVYTSDGELVSTGPFVHNPTTTSSLLFSYNSYPIETLRSKDGYLYLLVSSDLSTKVVKYNSNLQVVWKQLISPLVIDRYSLPVYYVGQMAFNDNDGTLFVTSTIDYYECHAWANYHNIPYIEPPFSADYLQSVVALGPSGSTKWAHIVHPPSTCAWVEFYGIDVSTDSKGQIHLVLTGDCGKAGGPWLQSAWIYHAILKPDTTSTTAGDTYMLMSEEHKMVELDNQDQYSSSIYSASIVDDGRAIVGVAEVGYRLQPGLGTLMVGGDIVASVINLVDGNELSQIRWNGSLPLGSDQPYGLLRLPSSTFTGCHSTIGSNVTPLQYVFVATLNGASYYSAQTGTALSTAMYSLCVNVAVNYNNDSSLTGDDDSYSSTADRLIDDPSNDKHTAFASTAGGVAVIVIGSLLGIGGVLGGMIWCNRRRNIRSSPPHSHIRTNSTTLAVVPRSGEHQRFHDVTEEGSTTTSITTTTSDTQLA